MSDAACAIRNAFRAIFGRDTAAMMCWAHVRRNVEKNIGLIKSSKKQAEALKDLDTLQVAPSKLFFESAVEMFKEKWKVEKQFLKYMDDKWLSTHQTWYEGVARGVPSTNNALESFNKKIKREGTLRQRLVVGDFIIRIESVMKDWSQESNFANKPNIQLGDWTSGYQWGQSKATHYKEVEDGASHYFGYVSSSKKISGQSISKWENMKWKNLDDYTNILKGFYKIQLPKNNWEDGTCSCGANMKRLMCKHIIGVALRKKLTIAPPKAKIVKLGMKRGVGRPKKYSHCLNKSS